MTTIDKSSYNEKCVDYESFAVSLKEALNTILSESGIKHIGVQFRIKTYDSFEKKALKKNNSFDNIEDICGLRIICFYQSDIEKICRLIKREFDVVNSINKEDELEADRFGYRSSHFVVTVKNKWLQTPNFRKYAGLKAEIQVRTILMHAWADIEHELCYKSEADVPTHLRRRLSRLSALIEIADEQFELVRKNRKEYLKKIGAGSVTGFNNNQEMNVDTLQAFLDIAMPERVRSKEYLPELLKELRHLHISFVEILNCYTKARPFLSEVSKITRNVATDEWGQIGAVRLSLELVNDKYWKLFNGKYPNISFKNPMLEIRKKIQQN